MTDTTKSHRCNCGDQFDTADQLGEHIEGHDDATRPRRFSAYDRDGGYITAAWLTTEANARRYHAKRHPGCQLIGPTGLILAA